MNNDSASSSTRAPAPEEISRRAYQLWEQSGRPEGRELEHWLQSERELQARDGSNPPASFGGGNDHTSDRNVAADSRPRGSGMAGARRGAGQGSATPFATEKPAVAEASGTRGNGGQRRRLGS